MVPNNCSKQSGRRCVSLLRCNLLQHNRKHNNSRNTIQATTTTAGWRLLSSVMSFAAIAVIGRYGQPLYLRDLNAPLLFDIYSCSSSPGQVDNAGFIEETPEQHSEWACGMKYQFALFAAYERALDMIDNGWKGVGGTGADACWMGLICNVDGYNAYGE